MPCPAHSPPPAPRVRCGCIGHRTCTDVAFVCGAHSTSLDFVLLVQHVPRPRLQCPLRWWRSAAAHTKSQRPLSISPPSRLYMSPLPPPPQAHTFFAPFQTTSPQSLLFDALIGESGLVVFLESHPPPPPERSISRVVAHETKTRGHTCRAGRCAPDPFHSVVIQPPPPPTRTHKGHRTGGSLCNTVTAHQHLCPHPPKPKPKPGSTNGHAPRLKHMLVPGGATPAAPAAHTLGDDPGTAEIVPFLNRTSEWGVVIAAFSSVLSVVPYHSARLACFLHPKLREITSKRGC